MEDYLYIRKIRKIGGIYMKRRLRGFTLIELIVVVAIITVLAMVIVPSTIYQIRSARVTEDNDHAHEIYNATQNYLIELQRKGLNPRTYFAETSETDRYAYWTWDNTGLIGVPEYQGYTRDSLGVGSNPKAFDTTGGSPSYGFQPTGLGADTDDSKPRACAQGIRKQLSGSTSSAANGKYDWFEEGSWGVVVDMETYSCVCAYYNTRGGGSPHANSQWWGIALVCQNPFESVDEQVKAIGNQTTPGSVDVRKNCGQYPIPLY